jgi:hypothetical protein
MAVQYTKMAITIPKGHEINHFVIPMPSKIYKIGIFWFENISSGNPDRRFLAAVHSAGVVTHDRRIGSWN